MMVGWWVLHFLHLDVVWCIMMDLDGGKRATTIDIADIERGRRSLMKACARTENTADEKNEYHC